jgi:hypothetical protein
VRVESPSFALCAIAEGTAEIGGAYLVVVAADTEVSEFPPRFAAIRREVPIGSVLVADRVDAVAVGSLPVRTFSAGQDLGAQPTVSEESAIRLRSKN